VTKTTTKARAKTTEKVIIKKSHSERIVASFLFNFTLSLHASTKTTETAEKAKIIIIAEKVLEWISSTKSPSENFIGVCKRESRSHTLASSKSASKVHS
jgi:hypothetical protein